MTHNKRIKHTAETFTESNKPLQNPYCGFYHIVRYTLNDEYTPSGNHPLEISAYTETLALLEINLKNYRACEITEKGLSQLDGIIKAWASSPSKTKLIIRFLYDWDGLAFVSEPDSLRQVKEHMEQVSKIINKYRDAVYIMQGVFIGNWGEMHHSKFADTGSVKALIHHLSELIDASIYLSVRTPSFWRAVNGMYSPPDEPVSQGINKPLSLRLGLFNDGMLGSETDLGTYGDTLRCDATAPEYKGTRKEELEFQNKLCKYVPNGGEAVFSEDYSKLEVAVRTLNEMHISYLNADYDSRVLDKWKSSVWHGNDVFNGCDGYSYIKAHLGYRYVIVSCKIKKSGLINPDYMLNVTVKNIGFSSALVPFETAVTLINDKTGERVCVSLDADFIHLESGSRKTVTAKLPIRKLSQGDYTLYFSVKDKSDGKPILFGNENELTENGYKLGNVTKLA